MCVDFATLFKKDLSYFYLCICVCRVWSPGTGATGAFKEPRVSAVLVDVGFVDTKTSKI